MTSPLRPAASAGAAIAWVAICVFVGTLMSLQARINGELATLIGSSLAAATATFGGGLVLIALGALGSKRWMRALPTLIGTLRDGRLKWWQMIGGIGGAFYVLVQAIVAPELGVALLTIAVVAGQTIGGLAVDRLGIGPGGVRELTLARLTGGVLVLAAVLLSVAGRLGGGFAWSLLLLPFIGGLGIAVQQAINGRVRAVTDVYSATLGNFIVGTFALLAAFAAGQLASGTVVNWGVAPWYLYLGGVVGVIGIAVAVAAVGIIGVLRLALSLVTGQLIGSIVLDLAFPTPTTVVTVWTYVGLAIALAAIVLTSVNFRRRLR